jgi:hypothetical protein
MAWNMSQRIGDLNGWWALGLKAGIALLPITIGGVGWLATHMLAAHQDHEMRLIRIETSRFKDSDAMDMERRMDEKAARAIASLEAKIDRLSDKLDAAILRSPR